MAINQTAFTSLEVAVRFNELTKQEKRFEIQNGGNVPVFKKDKE